MKKVLAMLLAMLMIFSMAAITVGAEGETAAETTTAKQGIYEIPEGAKTVTIKDRHGVDQEYTVVRTMQEWIAAVNKANEDVVTENIMGKDDDGNDIQTGIKITNEMTCRIILANDIDCENQVFEKAPFTLYRVTSWAKDPLKEDELTYVSNDSLATYIFEGNGFTLKNLSVINTTQTLAGVGSSANAVYYEDVEASIFGCIAANTVEITNLDVGTETNWVKISNMIPYATFRSYCGVLFQRGRTGCNIYLENVDIYGDIELNTAQGFGGVAGTATGNVELYNVNTYGSFVNRNKSDAGAGIGDQGGFFGGLGGTINDGYAYKHVFENCNNYATVEATNNAGGFGGYWGGRHDFINCRNYGQLTTVTGTDTNINAGGFIAHVNNCILDPNKDAGTNSEGKTYKNSYDVNGVHFEMAHYVNCMNLAPITGGSGRTGGFQGCDRRENIYDNCVNYGIITGSSWTGGFAGFTSNYASVTDAYATYNNCINYGRVVAAGNNQGGFVGCLGNGAKFYNCLNIGEVIQSGTTEGDHIGGFCGFAGSSSVIVAENCSNIGSVTANTQGGGKAGFFAVAQTDVVVTGCYQFGYLTSADPKGADGSFGHFGGDARFNAALAREGSSYGNNYAVANDYSVANGISKMNEYAVNDLEDGESVSSTYVTPEKAVEMLNERYESLGLMFRVDEITGMPSLASPAIRAVQHSDPVNDKQNIRLIGNLYSLDYKSAGFKVTVSYKDANGQTVTSNETTLTTSKVFKTITARDNSVLTNYSADKMLGVYLYALTIQDVPTNVGEVNITVTPIATLDNNGADQVYTGKAYVITYNNGEFVGNTAYVAPQA